MGRWSLGFLVLALVSGCGVEEVAPAEGPAVSQRQELRSLLPAPFVPATPAVYRPGMQLYPKTISSAYTITYGSDTNPREFYAWGFDVVNRECLFHVRGNTLDYAIFENDVGMSLRLVPQNNPLYIGSGGQGQIGTPRGPGPSGTDRWAEAFNHFYR